MPWQRKIVTWSVHYIFFPRKTLYATHALEDSNNFPMIFCPYKSDKNCICMRYSILIHGMQCMALPCGSLLQSTTRIGKTPVRIILWCPITKMLIKACFLVQPLEQEGVYQKCCISLCSKVFINHFYEMKASPECLNILTYFSKYWVDRLRRTIERKV